MPFCEVTGSFCEKAVADPDSITRSGWFDGDLLEQADAAVKNRNLCLEGQKLISKFSDICGIKALEHEEKRAQNA